MKDSGIKQAADRVGSQTRLAELLGVSKQVVSYWVRRGYVPPKWARRVETATGVSVAELCPEVFGK